MRKPDIAHVGYHRTGNKLLQKHVFAALGPYILTPSCSGRRFFNAPESSDEAAAPTFFANEQARNADDKPMLISSQRFTATREADDLTVADKLHRVNPDMRIILVLRLQRQMFPSLHYLHVKSVGALGYEDFVRRLVAGKRCRQAALVERFTALFGVARVLVLLYEDLQRAPESFVGAICDLLGVPVEAAPPLPPRVNARQSDSALGVGRWANRALGTERHPAEWKHRLRRGGMSLAQRLDARLRGLTGRPMFALDPQAGEALVRAAYAEDNRRLGALIGKPVGDYGYPA